MKKKKPREVWNQQESQLNKNQLNNPHLMLWPLSSTEAVKYNLMKKRKKKDKFPRKTRRKRKQSIKNKTLTLHQHKLKRMQIKMKM